MMYSVGQQVYWSRNVRGSIHERIGKVVAVIPEGVSPNSTVYGKVMSDNAPIRNNVSYLVLCKGVIFWVDRPQDVTDNNCHVEHTQKAPSVKRDRVIDKSDRLKFKRWLKKVGMDFVESDKCLHIPDARRRLWFAVSGGEEYLASIETIRIV